MSLFSKIEVNENMFPFIEKHEGVGIVKVDGYGKASARIESYKLILESYDDKNPIIESIAAINYLSYKKGNFFNEPKLEIGISHKKYVLAGVDNNDDELEAFYKKLLDIKNKEKEQKSISQANKGLLNSNSSVKEITTENMKEDIEEDAVETTEQEEVEEIVNLEEVINEDSESNVETDEEILDEIVETENVEEPESVNEVVETFDIEDNDDENFEVLAEISEEEISEKEDNNSVDVETEESVVETVAEEVVSEDEDDEDDEDDEEEEFEEIIFGEESNESEFNSEPIIEEEDDIEELREEEIDLDRVINESSEESEEEIETAAEEVESEASSELSSEEELESDRTIEEPVSESKNVTQTEEIISQTPPEKVKVTKENASAEIEQMKQKLSQNINDMQNINIPKNQDFAKYIPTAQQVDPVDQIRRYHELKEDGIITEEEFEQKKKQLLNL